MKDKIDTICAQLPTVFEVAGLTQNVAAGAVGVPALNYVSMALRRIIELLTIQIVTPVIQLQTDLRDYQGPAAKAKRASVKGAPLAGPATDRDIVCAYPVYESGLGWYGDRLLHRLVGSGEPQEGDLLDMWPIDVRLPTMLSAWSGLKPSIVVHQWSESYQNDRMDPMRPKDWFGVYKVTMDPVEHDGSAHQPFALNVTIDYDSGSRAVGHLLFFYNAQARESGGTPLRCHWGQSPNPNWARLRQTISDGANIMGFNGMGFHTEVFDTTINVYNAFEDIEHPGSVGFMPFHAVRSCLVNFFYVNGYDPLGETDGTLSIPSECYHVLKDIEAQQGPWIETTESLRIKRNDPPAVLDTFLTWCESGNGGYYGERFWSNVFLGPDGEPQGRVYRMRSDAFRGYTNQSMTLATVMDHKMETAEFRVWSANRKTWLKLTPNTLRTLLMIFLNERRLYVEQQAQVARDEKENGVGGDFDD